jgi:hypothetical protein
VRIDIDTVTARDAVFASRAMNVVKTALVAVAHRVSRVRVRRERTRWLARVDLVGGAVLDVEQATPAEDEGAFDHFAERIGRAVARHIGRVPGGSP